MCMLSVRVSVSPRVVFDVRDWYRSTFSAALIQADPADPGSKPLPGIVRPAVPVEFLVAPVTPPDPRWPFARSVALVTRQTPAGLHAFFGRVRVPGGPLQSPPGRRLNGAANCRLTIRAPGYQPHVIDPLTVPGADAAFLALGPIDLYPAGDYSFPADSRQPTLLEGALREADGTGIADVLVTPGDPHLRPVRTTPDGRFLQVLDYLDPEGAEDPLRISHSPLVLKFESPRLPGAVTKTIEFQPNVRNVLPATVLRGRLLRPDRRPLAGARVAVRLEPHGQELRGTTRSDTAGGWGFYGDVSLPLSGTRPATLLIGDEQRAEFGVTLHFGKSNDCGTLFVPPVP